MRKGLIARRKEKNITQQQLANAIKCTTRQLYKWEQGLVNVPFNKAQSWARKLGLTMNQFETLYINKER